MHSVQAFSLLALAGSVLAAPQGWGSWGGWADQGQDEYTATATAVVTAYTTVYGDNSWGRPTGAPQPNTPQPSTTPAAATTTPAATKPQASSWTAWTSAPSAAPSSSGSSDYIDIVNKWRSAMGMSSLTKDSTMEANDLKTVTDDQGTMSHELNSGTMAQVLAPGAQDEFEKVFVGGWLCERPDLPGLNGICNTMSQGWDYNGETGHADILTSTSYSKIGCAWADGIWGCDLS